MMKVKEDLKGLKTACKIIGVTILISIAIVALCYYFKFLEVIAAILKVETNDKRIVSVSRKDLFYITKKNAGLELIIEEMKSLGWNYVTRYGKGLVFESFGEEIVIIEKNLAGRYKIYVLDEGYRCQETDCCEDDETADCV